MVFLNNWLLKGKNGRKVILYKIFRCDNEKNEKEVYQKIPGLNPGKDWKNSCWPNGKASDYGYSSVIPIFHRPTR